MRKDWYTFVDLDALLAGLDRGWHRSPDPDPAERWHAAAVEHAWRAFAASHERSSDRWAWLRELVRLHGGSFELATDLVDAHAVQTRSRFGLRATAVEDHLVWRSIDAIWLASLPPRLREQLEHSLPIDPQPRRIVASEPPDGVLLRCSNHARYRTTTQKTAVRALCFLPPGQNLLVTMPTGSGKSLLFQLGVKWWNEHVGEAERACVLVIVPTIALALAHERTLRAIPGLERSRALTSALSHDEREDLCLHLQRGEIPILLAAPESALGSLREELERVAQSPSQRPQAERGHLAAVFIDEAHIIHSWGQSFRPDFQRLPGLIRQLRRHNPALRTVLLSATVGHDAKRLLRRQYAQDENLLEIAAQAPRTELDLCIHHFSDAARRNRLVVEIMDRLPRPAIIYATEVAEVELLYNELVAQGYQRLACFTGGTEASERQRIIDGWQDGDLDLVVATSAFGMGIDKSNVRVVVHASLPESAARLYQEIGRAGRDGHQALALVLSAQADEHVAKQIGSGQVLTIAKAEERWHSLLAQARRNGPVDARRLELNLGALLERVGPNTGRQHRRWNKALLVQLQRYGGLKVLAVDDEHDRWIVEIRQPRLLDDGPDAVRLLAQLLSARTPEVQAAARRVADLLQFVRTIEHIEADVDDDADPGGDPLVDYNCLMLALFEQIENSTEVLEPCGRCMCCRILDQAPPCRVYYQGGKVSWPAPDSGAPPFIGTRVVFSADPESAQLGATVRSLAEVGFTQFIVPNGRASEAARVLIDRIGHPGLVLEANDLCSDRWSALVVSTALVFDMNQSQTEHTMVYERVRSQVLASTRAGLLFVAPHDLTIAGKALSTIASSHGPMALDEFLHYLEAHT